MASELYVETLKGLTSGANANKVIIPSGQTLDITSGSLDVLGRVLQFGEVSGISNTTVGSSTFAVIDESGFNVTLTPAKTGNVFFCWCVFDVNHNTSGAISYGKIVVSTDGGSNFGDITSGNTSSLYITGGDRYEYIPQHCMGYHTSANTNAHKFCLSAATLNNNLEFGPSGNAKMFIYEVSQ